MSKETLLFGSTKPKLGLGFHNVGQVLRRSGESVVNWVNHHYGLRCGHLPPADSMGVLVGSATPEVVAQMDYLSGMIDQPLSVLEHANPLMDRPFVVPYIRTPETEQILQAVNPERIWGLPPELTGFLKNKAELHAATQNLAIPDFEVADFEITQLETLEERAYQFASGIENNYRRVGLHSVYPVGLMLRAAESDGNYGGCAVRQTDQGIIFIPDGSKENAIIFPSWQAALAKAHQYLGASMDSAQENRIVVSRYMDLADSPGMSVAIVDGQVYPLDWNGQVQPPDGSACIGTSTYNPNSPELKRWKLEWQDRSVAGFTRFMETAAQSLGVNFSQVSGMANVDLMIPGSLEIEYQKRLGQKPRVLVAEINPRWTNWTDALMLVMWVTGLAISVESMHATSNRGVLTSDKFPTTIPETVTMPDLRSQVAEVNYRLSKDGSGVILRMPDSPKAGFVFHGDVQLAQAELALALTKLHG